MNTNQVVISAISAEQLAKNLAETIRDKAKRAARKGVAATTPQANVDQNLAPEPGTMNYIFVEKKKDAAKKIPPAGFKVKRGKKRRNR